MTYKEALFFIGRSLTISYEPENLELVRKQINSSEIDWDVIVQLSTAHYVFPALYLNLYNANLLSFLPEDLVGYMEHITDLNRERNTQIIAQAKEINRILSKENISPIFLKGTASLLQGLYKDIGERMIGDIDFLISKDHYGKVISLLEQEGYSHVFKSKYDFPSYKHYPRIQKEGSIAAVEVHHQMTIGKYQKEFHYNAVANSLRKNEHGSFLSWENQLVLTLIAKQINDDGQHYKTMSLRNGYDVFLLSQKINSLEAIQKYPSLFDPLNHFLVLTQYIFNTESIAFLSSSKNDAFLKVSKRILEDEKFRKRHYKKTSKRLFYKARIQIVLKSFVRKDHRYWLFKRLTDSVGYKEKKEQLKAK